MPKIRQILLKSTFDPRAVTVLLIKNDQCIGFTCALPADYKDEEYIPEQILGKTDTAYIVNTLIAPQYRGQKLVGRLMETLEQELSRRGYSSMARNSAKGKGYAEKVMNHYSGRITMIFDFESAEYGPQVYMEILLRGGTPR